VQADVAEVMPQLMLQIRAHCGRKRASRRARAIQQGAHAVGRRRAALSHRRDRGARTPRDRPRLGLGWPVCGANPQILRARADGLQRVRVADRLALAPSVAGR
jgi:hypothetical protein